MAARPQMNQTIATRIAARMRRDGYAECDARDVWLVWDCGTHSNEGLASRIMQEFDEYGLRA